MRIDPDCPDDKMYAGIINGKSTSEMGEIAVEVIDVKAIFANLADRMSSPDWGYWPVQMISLKEAKKRLLI